MVFPASTQILAASLLEAVGLASQAKRYAESIRDLTSAGPVSANQILPILSHMKDVITRWTMIAALPGMAQYAKDQYDDQNINIVGEFAAMKQAAIDVRDWVINNFPSSGGYIQKDTLEADGAIKVRTFTSADTAGLRVALAAFISTIG